MPVRYLSWIAGFNRAENRLGVKVQLCTLPWLGLDPGRIWVRARLRRSAAWPTPVAGQASSSAGRNPATDPSLTALTGR